MLQDIRESAQGWIAWFIVILISVPFALWGIGSYLGGGSEPIVAKVNGQEITERDFDRAYRNYRDLLRQQMGKDYRPELLNDELIREQVLESMIREQLVLQASDDMGLSAGDALVRATIVGIPSFQVNGRFNQQAYERSVRSRGLTPGGFEAQVRRRLISEQLSKAITGSEFAPPAEVQALLRLRLQKRDLDYLLVPAERYLDQVKVDEAQLRSYYDSHQQEFQAPERVKLEYLDLDIANIAKTLSVDDETLRGYYEQHRQEYVTPGQRRASHILITLEEGADEQIEKAAREKVDGILERIRAGEGFAVLAKELSEDPGSAGEGGDLGYFERGVMDRAFDEVVFNMKEGEISEPVRTVFGLHIIKLTGIKPETGKPFEELKEELKTAYLKGKAERMFYEYAERLGDLAYEDPGSLQPAADALGMKTQQSDWITRNGGPGVLASQKLLGAAFGDDVLLEGNNSEPIEISPEQVIVLRVTEHEEASIRAYEDVKQEITDLLKQQQASELARVEGEKLLIRLQGGARLQDLAGEVGGEVVNLQGVKRDDTELPANLRRRLFRMPRPGPDKPVYGQAELRNGDVAIIALRAVNDGTAEDAAAIGGEERMKQALESAMGEAYYRHLLDNLRARAKIDITLKKG